MDRLLRGNRAFAGDLYRAVAAEKRGENLVFSPYSLSAAFSMTYRGAAGETARQMQQVLHLPSGSSSHQAFEELTAELKTSVGVTLRIVNRLFGQQGYVFHRDFLEACQQHYRAPLELLDFSAAPERARTRINDWVSQQTEKRILDLIPDGSLDSLTRLVLTNAVYFLGDWASPFDPNKTYDQIFWVRGEKKASVPTMHQTLHLGFAETEAFQLIELPYTGEEYSMAVVLPRERDGLGRMEEKGLDPEAIEAALASALPREVRVTLPRFEMTVDFGVKRALQGLGMTLAFDQRRADFSAMEPKKELYVSDAFHKAFVRVDEKGTEAAAATAVVMARKGISLHRPFEFRVDHPFLFVLRHRPTGTWLFLGRVTDPRK